VVESNVEPSPFSDQALACTPGQSAEARTGVGGRQAAILQLYVPGKDAPIVLQPTHAHSLTWNVGKVPRERLSNHEIEKFQR